MIAPTLDAPVYFDRLAQVETVHWWHAAMWRIASGWLDRPLRGRSGLVALDVGCGAGGTLCRLANRPEVVQMIGIDPSKRALSFASGLRRSSVNRSARARVPLVVLDQCSGGRWEHWSSTTSGTRYIQTHTVPETAVGSALALPFASRAIDLITCFDVLQHLPTGGDLIAMTELHRVLRPGGVAVIRANGAGLWPDPSRVDQPYRLRPFVNLARSAGLTVRRAGYVNCLPAVATELLGRLRRNSDHQHPQGGGLRIRPRHPWVNRMMGAVATAEAFAVTRMNVRLPVGHSTMMLVESPGGSTS